MKLDSNLITQLTSQPPADIVELNASNNKIKKIDDISVCVNLRKLYLSNNKIKQNKNLRGLQSNTNLTYLNLDNNKLESAEGLEKLSELCGMRYFLVSRPHQRSN